MKELCMKISAILKTIFGYGIMISLFAGGLTFFGYIAALIIGGDTASGVGGAGSTCFGRGRAATAAARSAVVGGTGARRGRRGRHG